MDGTYHSNYHREVLEALDEANVGAAPVSDLSLAIVEPKRFKRIEISDAEFGIPMFGTTALMWLIQSLVFSYPRTCKGLKSLS